MYTFEANTVAEAYQQILETLLKTSRVSESRGGKTLELLNTVVEISNPRARLMYHPKRKMSLIYAVVEALMLHNASDLLAPMALFNQRMANYSDDGIRLHGSYGHRIAPYMAFLCEKLYVTPETRQAVLMIGDSHDLMFQSKDIPCTNSLHFIVRNGQLHLTVHMRSNDVFLGFPYDVFSFTCFQEAVANHLGIPIGTYTHFATSMHLYIRDEQAARETLDSKSVEFAMLSTVNQMRYAAETYLDGVVNKAWFKSNASTNQFLELITRELEHITGKQPAPLDETIAWAAPFVKRWYS